eukprot:TRINITY_DN5170_c0_g2_i1.p1 TRINITY_DN5170_c0_g2~~TRINITY_DN5170_c0_g2_i1.p1  ORF type:complete len:349 (+),score=88.48 TRINITY_DN5170_c0_g2_i1:558-1604(+)
MHASEKLYVGIAAQDLLKKKKFAKLLQDFNVRAERVVDFVKLVWPQITCVTEELTDIYGPSIYEEVEVLVVSRETRSGGEMVNKKRVEIGRKATELVVLELVGGADADDVNGKMSSTYIRQWKAMHDFLQAHWQGLCQKLGIDAEVSNKWWRKIKQLYSEPQRYYHTLFHIESLIKQYDQFEGKLGFPEIVQLSIWFHDVVYQPTRTDNEEQSVLVFQEFCNESKNQDSFLALSVEDFILSTISHKPSLIKSQAACSEDDKSRLLESLYYFLDFDLSILGADQSEYLAYADAIRREYGHYSQEDFKSGRRKVLEKLMETQLFFSADYRESHNATALANMTHEIDLLTK